MKTQKVLITGAGGQLAWELQKCCPATVEAICLARSELDIANADDVTAALSQHKPDGIINAAAYTAVDKAESDSARAYAVNQTGVANLARAAGENVYLLHISTDFVFPGTSARAYRSDDACAPLGVYGKSKHAGERDLMALKPKGSALIRTAWVYSAQGNNFVKTLLRLMREKPGLGVVVDQIGTPTWAEGLAKCCWAALNSKLEGTYHWSDAGVASWYDFAVAIQEEAVAMGLLENAIPVAAIASEAYPTPAPRPAFSVLDKSEILAKLPDLQNVHWRVQLRSMLNEFIEQN